MLALEIALDVVLMIFVLAFLPLFLGDLLFFANPASGIGFLLFAGAFFGVLWIIDHLTDESFWLSLSGGRQIVAISWKRQSSARFRIAGEFAGDWRTPAE